MMSRKRASWILEILNISWLSPWVPCFTCFLRFYVVSWNSALCFLCIIYDSFSLAFFWYSFPNARTCSLRASTTIIPLYFHVQLKYEKLHAEWIFLRKYGFLIQYVFIQEVNFNFNCLYNQVRNDEINFNLKNRTNNQETHDAIFNVLFGLAKLYHTSIIWKFQNTIH